MKDGNQKRIQSLYDLPEANGNALARIIITTSQRPDTIVLILRIRATTDKIDRQSFLSQIE